VAEATAVVEAAVAVVAVVTAAECPAKAIPKAEDTRI
jgi:hypothetical protein